MSDDIEDSDNTRDGDYAASVDLMEVSRMQTRRSALHGQTGIKRGIHEQTVIGSDDEDEIKDDINDGEAPQSIIHSKIIVSIYGDPIHIAPVYNWTVISEIGNATNCMTIQHSTYNMLKLYQ